MPFEISNSIKGGSQANKLSLTYSDKLTLLFIRI